MILAAGCGDDPEPEAAAPAQKSQKPQPETSAAPEPAPEPAPAAETRPHQDALARVISTGKLVAGVAGNLPPFGFRPDAAAEPEGYEIDLIRAVASRMGVEAELVVLLPSERLPAVTAGRVDVAAGALAHTFAREQAVDFTLPVFMDGQKLLVHKGSGITGLTGLAGRPVAAASGSGAAALLHEAAPEAEVRAYKDYVNAFLAVKRGEAQALTADAMVLLRLRAADVNPELWHIVGPFLSRLPFALAVPENQSDLRDEINKALAGLWASGDFQRIYDKWFGPDTEYPLPLDFSIEVWPGAVE